MEIISANIVEICDILTIDFGMIITTNILDYIYSKLALISWKFLLNADAQWILVSLRM